MRFGWIWQIASLEWRRLLSYRTDYWVNFWGGAATQLVLAVFLWGSIYESSGKTEIGGYTFFAMVLYYILVSFINRLFFPNEVAQFAGEIFTGSITKLFLYPVSVFTYRLTLYYAYVLAYLQQLLLGLLLF